MFCHGLSWTTGSTGRCDTYQQWTEVLEKERPRLQRGIALHGPARGAIGQSCHGIGNEFSGIREGDILAYSRVYGRRTGGVVPALPDVRTSCLTNKGNAYPF